MKQKIEIFHYPSIIDDDFAMKVMESNIDSSTTLVQNEIAFSGPKANIEELILHAYISLGPEFWNSYFSGTLSAATIDLLKYLLNKIGVSSQGKKVKYITSRGKKEFEVNYGLKAHPKKGYSIGFHVNGNITEDMMEKMLKHVEGINSLNQSHFYEQFEMDANEKSIKKKKLKK